jgi:hypothetical protein
MPKAGKFLIPMSLLVAITVTFACETLVAGPTLEGLSAIMRPQMTIQVEFFGKLFGT